MTIDNGLAKLLDSYSKQEGCFTLLDGTSKFSELVTAANNDAYPIQRWFHLKEAFSLDLLSTLLDHWEIDLQSIHRVLDPFCGIGTSLLAVQKLAKQTGTTGLEAFGFERNPFLQFVADTKVHWSKYDAGQLKLATSHLMNGVVKTAPDTLPDLSTFRRRDIYSPGKLKAILGYRSAIDKLDASRRAPMLLGYASVLEDLSGVRKDGRALRIVPNKQRPTIPHALRSAWNAISDDLAVAGSHYTPVPTKVFLGDGRSLVPDVPSAELLNNVDLAIYSPPYLNNIDYTEVYKLELWLSGFISDRAQFRALRHRTFRSHPSVRFRQPIAMSNDTKLSDVVSLLDTLIDALPRDDDFNPRSELFRGYFDDMYLSLLSQTKALRAGGWIFCVVGNSLHGSNKVPQDRVPIAADIVIAAIAKAVGLEVKAIQVARQLKRRAPDSHLLRESIVVMQKPNT